jgi:hypothetical protein
VNGRGGAGCGLRHDNQCHDERQQNDESFKLFFMMTENLSCFSYAETKKWGVWLPGE